MEEKFEMSDLGLLAYYLGIEVTQTNGDISIKQSAYANKILKEAGMIDCNETLISMDPGTRLTKVTEGTMVNSTEYQSLIGCLRYLLHTRPDLSYSVVLLSRFMQEPREQHMKAIRQVLRYVKGIKDYEITYKHNRGNKIHGYSDSSYGVNTQEEKGTTGIIFYYGESPISWSMQKQATVALSSCESEFIAATTAATQALWWDLEWQQWGSFSDWNLWFSTIRLKSKVKSLLEWVFNVAWWSVWVFRNRVVFMKARLLVR
nr:ribonuclease H-like domain, reverse transcriptase, RNA-dependent DNA polymerase [Tanacetum cinerariifolium]